MRCIVATVVVVFAGCGVAQYRDVSGERGLAGQRFVSTAELLIHAVTVEPAYKRIIHHYVITPMPGFGGPEVLFRKSLPPGTEIQEITAQQCSNCLLGRDRVLVNVAAYTDNPASIATEHLNIELFSQVGE